MKTTDLLIEELSTLNGSEARLILAAHFIIGVIKLNTVNLTRLALAFENEVEAESNYKRLQRFFRHFEMDFSALARLMARWLPEEPWVLCLDRTLWQVGKSNVNVLMLAIAYRGIAVPLMWTVMEKKGNSNTDERITLLKRFVQLFGQHRIAYLTADREFRGREWLNFLITASIPFRLRIPNNTRLKNRYRNRSFKATHLFPLKVGEVMTFKQPRAVWGIPVYLGAVRTPSEHAIIIANTYTPSLVADSARRWEIETLFGCLKSRGFDMEGTRLRDPERLSKLLALLAIAFAWCYRVGLWRVRLKPIRRLKHSRPALTWFRYGLDYLNRVFHNVGRMVDKLFNALKLLSTDGWALLMNST